MISRWTLAAAGLLAAGAALGQSTEFTVESHGTRATVSARPLRDPAGGLLTISVVSGARSASWEYRNLFLDEESGAPAAAIPEANHRDYLLVRAYTGGAGCCWTLLAFDLVELRPLGPQVASQSPIELVRGRYGCELGAIAIPVDGREPAVASRPAPALYCFDGRKFERKAAEVPAPFQSGSGEKEPPQ